MRGVACKRVNEHSELPHALSKVISTHLCLDSRGSICRLFDVWELRRPLSTGTLRVLSLRNQQCGVFGGEMTDINESR
jgi:hypothetical protein